MAKSKSINTSTHRTKAAGGLERVMAAIDKLSLQEQESVVDMALRILRIASQEDRLSPFAMALASAQMAHDITPQ